VHPDYPYANAPRLPESEPLHLGELFGHTQPVDLELGPGRGGFIQERALQPGGPCIVGLEIRRKWATKVDERLAALGLSSRARVFAEDARLILPRLASASIGAVFVHFPDPWWKKRHHKRLLLGPDVLAQLARVVIPGGELYIQTDVEERAEQYEAVVAGEPAFTAIEGGPRVAENPYGAYSPRERRSMADEVPVFRLRYRRRDPVAV